MKVRYTTTSDDAAAADRMHERTNELNERKTEKEKYCEITVK